MNIGINIKKISGASPENFRNKIHLNISQNHFDSYVDQYNSLYSQFCFSDNLRIKTIIRTVYPQLIGLRQYIYHRVEQQQHFTNFDFTARSLQPNWNIKSRVKGEWQFFKERVWSGHEKSLVFELPTPALKEYAAATGVKMAYLPPSYFHQRKSPLPRLDEEIRQLAVTWSVEILAIIQKSWNQSADEDFQKALQLYLQELFIQANGLIQQLSGKLSRLSYGNVMAQSLGNPFLRLLCSANKVCGKEVIGFTHANELTFFSYRMDTANLSLLTMMDRIVVSTERMASMAQESMATFFHRPSDMPKIEVHPHVDYGRMLREFVCPEEKRKVKRIMIIDRGLSPVRYPGFTTYWPVTLDLNIRMAKVLRDAGHHVTLKYHPDNKDYGEVNALYHASFDQVIAEPFEKVCKETDMFIFPHHMATTTLVPAIMTGKPIVSLSTIIPWMTESLIPAMASRVKFIDAGYNEQNYIDFSEGQLLDHVQSCQVEDPNPNFIKEFLVAR